MTRAKDITLLPCVLLLFCFQGAASFQSLTKKTTSLDRRTIDKARCGSRCGHRRALSVHPSCRPTWCRSCFDVVNQYGKIHRTQCYSQIDEDLWTETSDPSFVGSDLRHVDRVEQYARLPVWPVWNGVLLFVISKLFGTGVASQLEELFGGRVCPNFFENDQLTSPFIMLVHHSHSFGPNPLRFLQRTFFPEGFPAHPHRGFVTVTYILKGGFTHRDSIGVRQKYGAEKRHGGFHTQWLTTGAGILHEEMFDIEGWNERQELFQLWLNVPSQYKLDPPQVDLLGPNECPVVKGDSTETIVLAGTHAGMVSNSPAVSSVGIYHVKLLDRGASWEHELPSDHHNAIMYVRQGSVKVGGATSIEPHHTAFLKSSGSRLVVEAGGGPADFILLTGAPLNEPVAAQGSMVMNTESEIQTAYADYQRGRMGLPWSETLTDDEWIKHVRQNPSAYSYTEK